MQVVLDEPTVLRGQAAGLRARVLANKRRDDEAISWVSGRWPSVSRSVPTT
ncbi:hypothetical protein [Aeromicrobium sp. UC242_57]|uniref:hypothetical protein n=1 Tax=Aeromicrobium sp. UC242_57 TaxID=3374624 RepID=UPI00379634FA